MCVVNHVRIALPVYIMVFTKIPMNPTFKTAVTLENLGNFQSSFFDFNKN